MMSSSSNTTRIAKNTLLLYFRMLLTMGVTLYTSRVVLDVLGVEDYGIYNVVGGIVAMLGFLQWTMQTTSARFINVVLSTNYDLETKKTFSNILAVNIFLSVIVCLLAETVGLWFFAEKMTIPHEREYAVFWVYQISVITVVLNIITVPFNATIIAHERMNVFAYISIFDAIGKLLVTYLIKLSPIDRLIFYALLVMLIYIVDFVIYIMYCLRNFPECRGKILFDKLVFKNILGFITWSSYGSFVSAGFTQGLNIILNLFFGPAVNAARGIAVQVQNAVVSFTNNFQTAINPQLMKATAQKNYAEAQKLFFASSKYSFFLLCILGLPILIETSFILSLWLKEVPEYTAQFCRIILTISIWGALANPLRVVNQAEGNIKKFQLYECTLLLLIMPISYLCLKIWQIPILVFIVHLVFEIMAQFVRVVIVTPKINLSFRDYMTNIYLKVIPVFIIPIVAATLLVHIFSFENLIVKFLCTSIVIEVTLFVSIYWLGLSKTEKIFLKTHFEEIKRKIIK